MSAKVYGKITVIKRNGSSGSQFPVTSSQCTFGRNADCEIRIQLPTVSERECSLNADENGNFVLSRMNQAGEVLVNNKVVSEDATISNNDVLTIAGRSFRFEYPPTMKMCQDVMLSAKGTATPKSNLIERVKQSHGRRVSFGPQLSPEQFASFLPPNTPVKKGAIPMQTLDNTEEANRRRSVLKESKRRVSKGVSPKNVKSGENSAPKANKKRSFDELVALVGLDKAPPRTTQPTIATKQASAVPNVTPSERKKTPRRKSKQITPQLGHNNIVATVTKSTPSGCKSVGKSVELAEEIMDSYDLFDDTTKGKKSTPSQTPKRRSKVNGTAHVETKGSELSSTSTATPARIENLQDDLIHPILDDTIPYESPSPAKGPTPKRRSSKAATPKPDKLSESLRETTPSRRQSNARRSSIRNDANLTSRESVLDDTIPMEVINPSVGKKRSSSVKVATNTPVQSEVTPQVEHYSAKRRSTARVPTPTPLKVEESRNTEEKRSDSVTFSELVNNAAMTPPQDDACGSIVSRNSDDTVPYYEEPVDESLGVHPTGPAIPKQEENATLGLDDTVPIQDIGVPPPIGEPKTPRSRRKSGAAKRQSGATRTPKVAGRVSMGKTPKSAMTIPMTKGQKSFDVAEVQSSPKEAETVETISTLAVKKTPKSATPAGRSRETDVAVWIQTSSDSEAPKTPVIQDVPKTPKSAKSDTPTVTGVVVNDTPLSGPTRRTPRSVKTTPAHSVTPGTDSTAPVLVKNTPKSLKVTQTLNCGTPFGAKTEISIVNSPLTPPNDEMDPQETPSQTAGPRKTPRSSRKSIATSAPTTPAVVLTPKVTRTQKAKTPQVVQQMLVTSQSTPQVTTPALPRKAPRSAKKTPGTSRRKSVFKNRQSVLLSARKKRKSGVLLWSEIVRKNPGKEQEMKPAPVISQQTRLAKRPRRSMPRTPQEMRELHHAESPATIYIGRRTRRKSDLSPVKFEMSSDYSSEEDSYIADDFRNDIADTTHDFGTGDLMKTPKVKGEAVAEHFGTKRLLKTPKEKVKGQPVEEDFGTQRLLKTPKVKGQPVQENFGTKRLLKTPVDKVKGQPIDSEFGTKRLLKTPKDKVKGEPVEKHFGTKRLLKTPKVKGQPVTDNFGTKRLLKTPKVKGEEVTEHLGTRRLLQTPEDRVKGQMVEEHLGTKRLLKTPKEKVKGQQVEEKFGLKRLLQTPKDKVKGQPVSENFGIAQMMKTPRQKNKAVTEHFGTKRLLHTPKEKIVFEPVDDEYGFDTIFGDSEEEQVQEGGKVIDATKPPQDTKAETNKSSKTTKVVQEGAPAKQHAEEIKEVKRSSRGRKVAMSEKEKGVGLESKDGSKRSERKRKTTASLSDDFVLQPSKKVKSGAESAESEQKTAVTKKVTASKKMTERRTGKTIRKSKKSVEVSNVAMTSKTEVPVENTKRSTRATRGRAAKTVDDITEKVSGETTSKDGGPKVKIVAPVIELPSAPKTRRGQRKQVAEEKMIVDQPTTRTRGKRGQKLESIPEVDELKSVASTAIESSEPVPETKPRAPSNKKVTFMQEKENKPAPARSTRGGRKTQAVKLTEKPQSVSGIHEHSALENTKHSAGKRSTTDEAAKLKASAKRTRKGLKDADDVNETEGKPELEASIPDEAKRSCVAKSSVKGRISTKKVPPDGAPSSVAEKSEGPVATRRRRSTKTASAKCGVGAKEEKADAKSQTTRKRKVPEHADIAVAQAQSKRRNTRTEVGDNAPPTKVATRRGKGPKKTDSTMKEVVPAATRKSTRTRKGN